MKELGESLGVCLNYQTADDIAGELADDQIAKGTKKKKEQLMQQIKKDMNLNDQIRVLIFKDGVCVTSADQLDKDKILLDSKNILLALLK